MAEQNEEKQMKIEEAFAELSKILERMDADDVSLEESLALYERGVKLVRYCNAQIDRVEKKVQALSAEGETHDF